MRVLVIGSGGREHALVWKIAQSPLVEKIYCAPGNAGIAQLAECVPIPHDDIKELGDFATMNQVGLTVVGPEAPLIAGIVDHFEARGLPIFGPSRDPARIEGSKIFAKQLMQSANIPTAAFWTCSELDSARQTVREYYRQHGAQASIVIKADGLARGQGVTVARNEEEAYGALKRLMEERALGKAGERIVIEECLVGEEASFMVITDGIEVVPLLLSQDHKRAFEGDQGPNTGGMGAYSPVPFLPQDTARLAEAEIVRPALAAIRALGIPYRGVLYAGLMITKDGPKCIEFNCRLGDPETQAILPLLESDLVPLLIDTLEGTLNPASIQWSAGASVCVVAASGGYPGPVETGKPITGIEEAAAIPDCFVFQAGTTHQNDHFLTAGGRVLAVTGLGPNTQAAALNAYQSLSHIHFDGMQFRRDIASRVFQNPPAAPSP